MCNNDVLFYEVSDLRNDLHLYSWFESIYKKATTSNRLMGQWRHKNVLVVWCNMTLKLKVPVISPNIAGMYSFYRSGFWSDVFFVVKETDRLVQSCTPIDVNNIYQCGHLNQLDTGYTNSGDVIVPQSPVWRSWTVAVLFLLNNHAMRKSSWVLPIYSILKGLSVLLASDLFL